MKIISRQVLDRTTARRIQSVKLANRAARYFLHFGNRAAADACARRRIEILLGR